MGIRLLFRNSLIVSRYYSVPLRDDSKESPSRVSIPRRETKTLSFFLNPLAVCILMDGQSTKGVQ
jgi:hypothetical protein